MKGKTMALRLNPRFGNTFEDVTGSWIVMNYRVGILFALAENGRAYLIADVCEAGGKPSLRKAQMYGDVHYALKVFQERVDAV